MRDVHGDYKRAYLEEYEAYRRVGRDEEAERIAGILRDHYGHDVDDAGDGGVVAAPERADAARPPENTAEPKPAPAARKTAAKKPAAPAAE